MSVTKRPAAGPLSTSSESVSLAPEWSSRLVSVHVPSSPATSSYSRLSVVADRKTMSHT
jgi:hypothetical protein